MGFPGLVSNRGLLLKIIVGFITVDYYGCLYHLHERKVIGFMQVRIGHQSGRALGFIQPFADLFKLIFKEVVRP